MARTRAEDYEDKQRHILDTAAYVFSEYGMDKASMAEIARHGKISKALLYHYYTSKTALIFDIVRTHLQDLDDALEAIDPVAEPAEARLRVLIREVVEFYKDADEKHRVQLNSARTLSEEQSEALRQIERRIVRRFADVLRAVNPNLDGDRPLLMPATMSLFGMLNWIYMWFRPDGSITRDDYADMVADLMLGGLKTLR